MKFFVQVFDEDGCLVQVSDLVPFKSSAVVREYMKMYLSDHEDAIRAISFVVDGDCISVHSCISMYGFGL